MVRFIEALKTGREARQGAGTTVIGTLIGEIDKVQKRRREEETRQKDEDFELKKILTELDRQQEGKIELEREKKRLEGVPLGQTPAGAIAPTAEVREGDRPSVTDTLETREGEPGSVSGLLQQTGIQPRGRTVTVDPNTGEQVFIPETQAEEKSRLQTDKLRREATPEGRAQLVKEEAQAKAAIKEATDKVVAKTKVTLGRLVSRNNLEAVSGQFSDLANVWIDAFQEGGAGGFIQSGVAKAATAVGDLPDFLGGGEIGGKFPRSGAFEGKKQETLLKMMPMLTQQGLKSEGSVRIITSILEALGKTLPDLKTSARTAKEQFSESQKSFFRFARAAELLGADFDNVFAGQDPNNISEEALKGWAASVNAAASRVKVEGAEADAFDNLVDTSLSRFDEIIGDKEDLSQMSDEELRAIAGGK